MREKQLRAGPEREGFAGSHAGERSGKVSRACPCSLPVLAAGARCGPTGDLAVPSRQRPPARVGVLGTGGLHAADGGGLWAFQHLSLAPAVLGGLAPSPTGKAVPSLPPNAWPRARAAASSAPRLRPTCSALPAAHRPRGSPAGGTQPRAAQGRKPPPEEELGQGGPAPQGQAPHSPRPPGCWLPPGQWPPALPPHQGAMHSPSSGLLGLRGCDGSRQRESGRLAISAGAAEGSGL